MKSVTAVDYLLADGSIVTVKISTSGIFKHFESGVYALLNTELTDGGRNMDKRISVPIFDVAVTHVVIRLGDDSSLIKDDGGTIGTNIELSGVDDD
jgi:hypothetical protein